MIAIALISWLKAKREGYSSKGARRFRGGARVAAYVGVVSLAALGFSVKRAHADLGEGSLKLGREMASLAGTLQDSNQILLNGESVFVGTGSSSDPISTILDRFEANCGDADTVFSDIVKQVGPVEAKKIGLNKAGTLRREAAGEGTVMCFVRGSESQGGLMKSLERFTETKDLGALGKVRYAYVRQGTQGSSEISMLWTNDSLRLDRIMPPSGVEGEGPDPSFAPRPTSARRMLSTRAVGTEYAAYVYEAKGTPSESLAFYETAMKQKGFDSVKDPLDRPIVANSVQRMYERDGVLVVFVAAPREDGGSQVSLIESGVARGISPSSSVSASK
jgi:hypothetical protein